MSKLSVSEQVMKMAKPIVENLGYELVEVKYGKGHSGMEMTLYIYSKQGITLNDCEKVSKAIDEPLDELNPTNDVSYSLNVSSLGIDRPIKSADDARRNLENKIEVKLYAPKDGKKIWTGILTEYTQDTFTIKIKENDFKTFRFDEIAIASPVIEF